MPSAKRCLSLWRRSSIPNFHAYLPLKDNRRWQMPSYLIYAVFMYKGVEAYFRRLTAKFSFFMPGIRKDQVFATPRLNGVAEYVGRRHIR